MVPICFVLVLALAIILERFWSCVTARIAPPEALNELWRLDQEKRAERQASENTLHSVVTMGVCLASGLPETPARP